MVPPTWFRTFKVPVLMSQSLCFDVGSFTTRVMLGSQLVYNQPTCLTIHQPTQTVVEVGTAAYGTLGKVPAAVEVVFPIKYGVISRPALATLYLRSVLKKVFADEHRWPIIFGLKATLALPAAVTPVEKNIWKETLQQAGITQVRMVPRVVAIQRAIADSSTAMRYRCVIDIGAQTTDIGLLSNSELIASTTIQMGGENYTQEVISLLRDEYQCEIGIQTAEKMKFQYRLGGELKAGGTKASDYKITLRGKQVASGVPTTISVASSLLRERFTEVTRLLIAEIQTFLAQAPAEVLTAALEDGLYLTGGGSLLPGVVEMLGQELKTHYSLAKHPQEDVVKGLFRS
jgi:rod shape-determining protein MreB and related proteins